MPDKNLEIKRVKFFSDAVVAIAITLLALDLKVEVFDDKHLTFADVGNIWQKLLAFGFSFLNISIFWKIHVKMFRYFRVVDGRMIWYNTGWLLFIVILPFTTSLVSSYFDDTAAIFLYCLNTFLVTLSQHQIWSYATTKPDYLKEGFDDKAKRSYRFSYNVAMVNEIIACGISFISPLTAFLILFIRFPVISISRKIASVDPL